MWVPCPLKSEKQIFSEGNMKHNSIDVISPGVIRTTHTAWTNYTIYNHSLEYMVLIYLNAKAMKLKINSWGRT